MTQIELIENNTKTKKQEHHFFASFGMGWAIGDTQEEAVEKLINRFRREFKKIVAGQHKAGEPGAYVWTCRVEAPRSAEYKINFFAPQGVEVTNTHECFVTYVSAKEHAYWVNVK